MKSPNLFHNIVVDSNNVNNGKDLLLFSNAKKIINLNYNGNFPSFPSSVTHLSIEGETQKTNLFANFLSIFPKKFEIFRPLENLTHLYLPNSFDTRLDASNLPPTIRLVSNIFILFYFIEFYFILLNFIDCW